MGVPRPSSGVCELIREIFAAADAQDGEAMFRLHAAEPSLTFVASARASSGRPGTRSAAALRGGPRRPGRRPVSSSTAASATRTGRWLGIGEGRSSSPPTCASRSG